MSDVREVLDTLPEKSVQVFEYIYKRRTLSKVDLCGLLDKNMTFINRMVAPLEASGLIIPTGKGDSTGGRKPTLYEVNPKGLYVGAFNISSTYCEVALVNLKLEPLFMERFAMPAQDGPDQVVPHLVSLLLMGMEKFRIANGQICGIGVSVFGSFNAESGSINRPIALYANEAWLGYPLAGRIEELTGLHVEMEKGTNAAALLEYLYGKGRKEHRMLYVLCAMNIRTAFILNGIIVNAAPNNEDAFGHMTIDMDGEACECGNYGCVAAYATIPSIIRTFCIELKKGRVSVVAKRPEDVTFEDICQAVEVKDQLAVEVITRSATILGSALANYINLVGPSVVIISGLIPQRCGLYYTVAVQTARKKTERLLSNTTIRFENGGTFDHAITLGSASVVVERMIERRITPSRYTESNEGDGGYRYP